MKKIEPPKKNEGEEDEWELDPWTQWCPGGCGDAISKMKQMCSTCRKKRENLLDLQELGWVKITTPWKSTTTKEGKKKVEEKKKFGTDLIFVSDIDTGKFYPKNDAQRRLLWHWKSKGNPKQKKLAKSELHDVYDVSKKTLRKKKK